jgi:beta-1,4-mannosyltransferase
VTSSPLRVLASPLRMPGNPYIDQLYEHVGDQPRVSLRPYTRRELARGSWDIVHMHWPEWVVRQDGSARAWSDACTDLALLQWARRRGARLAWTAHDLRPHDAEKSRVLAWFMDQFVRQVDCLFALSHRALAEVGAEHPRLAPALTAVVPHGHYRRAYPDPELSPEEAKRSLGLPADAEVLLFFGQLRPYKDVPRLIECFRMTRVPRAHLLVAGRPIDDRAARAVMTEAGADPRVHVRLEQVPDGDVHRFFRACRSVILPYRRILNSGAALLALSFDRPVVVPALGSLVELQEQLGPRWVSTFDGRVHAEVVERALTVPPPVGTPPIDRYDWPQIGRSTVDAYRQVVAIPRRSHRPVSVRS